MVWTLRTVISNKAIASRAIPLPLCCTQNYTSLPINMKDDEEDENSWYSRLKEEEKTNHPP